jgi:hypothetical protein
MLFRRGVERKEIDAQDEETSLSGTTITLNEDY